MNEVKPSIGCSCGEANLELAIEYSKPPTGEVTRVAQGTKYCRKYYRCVSCSHFFSRHDLDLSALYESAYINDHYGSIQGIVTRFEHVANLPFEKSDNKQRVARIKDFMTNLGTGEGKALDIGAGIGVFGFEMNKVGWQVVGLEMDEVFVRHLNDYVGVKSFTKDLFEVDVNEIGTFNLITLNKVLEHVEKPHLLLARATEFLKPNGIIYVEVPDIEALSLGSNREEFFVEHHHVFSKASLEALAKHSGLSSSTIEAVREPLVKL